VCIIEGQLKMYNIKVVRIGS